MKKIMMSFLLAGSVSQASVNLQTGSWVWSENVGELTLTYNSRSLHHGWWGQGWCSDIDAEVKIDSYGKPHFRYCSQEISEVSFHKQKESLKVFHLNKAFLFDHQGRLLSVKAPSLSVQISYKKNSIDQFNINNREWGVSTSEDSRRIVKVTSSSVSIGFQYKNSLLEKIESDRSPSKIFEYDAFDNMVAINEASAFSKPQIARISYSPKDRVSRVLTPNSCESRYTFDEQKTEYQVLLFSKIYRHCTGFQESSYVKAFTSHFQLFGDQSLKLLDIKEVYL